MESEAEEAGAEAAEDDSRTAGMGQKVKIVLSMVQITSAMMEIIEVDWPVAAGVSAYIVVIACCCRRGSCQRATCQRIPAAPHL